MKKLTTKITEANEGMHSPTNYRKAMDMLLTHPYTNARLYHLVLTGSEKREDYRWAVERLCKELRSKDMPCMWKACYELDDKKRFHMHLFLLVESANKVPCTIIRYRKGGWLVNKLAERGIGFNISQPQNQIHWQGGTPQNYAYVPKKAGPKLDDCLVWVSYLYKVRSKAGVEGQIYTSSTNRGSAKARPTKQAATPQAEQVQEAAAEVQEAPQAAPVVQASPQAEPIAPAVHEQPTNEGEADMSNNELSAAAHAYVKGIYSRLVAQDLNLEQMRTALKDSGLLRNIHQITFDLEERYGWKGYASKHQAPRPRTLHELAQAEDSKVAKTKRIVLEPVEVTHFHPLLRRVQAVAERA
jgi:hypothetical protein